MPKSQETPADDGETEEPEETSADTVETQGCVEKDKYLCPNWKKIVDPKGFNNQRCTTCKAERRV